MFGSFEFFSKSVDTNVKVSLYIPDKLLKGHKEDIKVLYLLHGYSGNNDSWFLGTSAIAYADKYNMAIVSPMAHNGFYSNNVYGGLNYLDLVEKEVPDFLQDTFGIMKHKENTFIGGFSMGGFGAIKVALLSNRFKAVASFSGALFNLEDYTKRWEDETQKRKLQGVFYDENGQLNENACLYDLTIKNKDKLENVFITCGTNDEKPNLYNVNLTYMELLKNNDVDFEYYSDDNGHDFIHWTKALERYFEFLEKKNLI